MLLEIPSEQVQSTVRQFGRELLAEAGIDRPPVNAFRLARSLGLTIAQDGRSEVRARFVRLSPRNSGTILLADEARDERRQWAVAHEIGEFVAEEVFAELGISLVDIPPSAREQVANQLAEALMLPSDWFQRDGELLDWDLWELKTLYATASHELISRRMLQMPPPVVVSLFDQGKLVWRRSNVLHRPPLLTSVEHRIWQMAHQQGRVYRFTSGDLPEGLSDVRCWPVHEPSWRREIMRTALEDW